MSSRFKGESRTVDLEILWLKAKTRLMTLVQLSGFFLVGLGIFDMFGPFIEANGVDLSILPTEMLESVLAQIGISPLFVMVGGAIIIWLSTSTR